MLQVSSLKCLLKPCAFKHRTQTTRYEMQSFASFSSCTGYNHLTSCSKCFVYLLHVSSIRKYDVCICAQYANTVRDSAALGRME